MKKNFVKMNNNQNQLSLGNFCKSVKELAQNKTFANQTEVFYCLFGVEDVSDSTINNYCIGYRAINVEFKQKYIIYQKKYQETPQVLDEVIIGLMSILDGIIYKNLSHETVRTLHSLAARAFIALDGSLYMRVDFFMDGDGRIYLNEVNTIPGSTPTSHFNILARELGGFAAVLDIMLESALARHEREKSLRRLYG